MENFDWVRLGLLILGVLACFALDRSRKIKLLDGGKKFSLETGTIIAVALMMILIITRWLLGY